MKKLHKSIVGLGLLVSVFLFSGCGVVLVTEDGNTDAGEEITKEYDFSDFTGIDIGSAFLYEIRQSDTYSIRITAYEGIFDNIDVDQDEKTLEINTGFLGFNWGMINIQSRPRVVITMPLLEKLDSSGATKGTVTGFDSGESMRVVVSGASKVTFSDIEVDEFDINVSGASDVQATIVAEMIDMHISGASEVDGTVSSEDLNAVVTGSSDLTLDGTVTDLAVIGSGASELELDGVQAVDADITLSGASDCDINVSGKLDVDLSGASSLEYIGDPDLEDIEVSSSSKLEKK